jgi:hypothetical protein
MHSATRTGLVVLLASALFFSGCMSAPAGISASTKPLKQGGYTELGPVNGKAWGAILLGIPIGEMAPARKAVDRAIEKGGGDALVNVTADYTQLNLFVASILWTSVNGTAVKSID